MISFDNTEVAFRGKSKGDLNRAYWLFKVVSSPAMVRFGKWATNVALRLKLPIKAIIKKTIFRQFCGGESIQESLKASKTLASRNVKTILDYSIEGKTKEEDFDKTVQEIIGTIREGENNKNIPFAVFKVTGICLHDILEKSNDGIENLSTEEKKDYDKLKERVSIICLEAYNRNVPIFIDAEESWIQNTIDRLAYEMSVKFNQKTAVVYNTIQLYRHDRLAFLKSEIARADKENFKLGVKLVRGAYMEKERARAEEQGYPSPIQPNKDAADKDFNASLKVVIERIDRVSFCAGTHNEESSMLLVKLLKEYGVDSSDPRAYFAQLLGMSDHISFNLADNDLMVAKYVPYGPIKEVLPYLIRRADENTSVTGQTGRELSLIMKERKRRKTKL
ncbi:MAG: proline dehydrogenase family protein [Crocinitomicaceae bacterium]|tara:strand:- start:5709 stop:6881 length:1173 start_codon:yes stop_codon:yes gene_type:complete